MRILWRTNYDLKGNGYGYTTHQKNLRAALERREDVRMVNTPEEADVAVSITMPTNYAPLPDVFNVLYTMYETSTLPNDWIIPLHTPDLLVVPNQHNRRLFRGYVKGVPIEVVGEGIDAERFTFHPRTKPTDRPFTFLWIGASNPRKGYQHIATAWGLFCQRFPEIAQHCALVMKTTQDTKPERLERYPVALSNGAQSMCFVDTRDYSLDELIELYRYSHAFLFPSMGEGWGLTLHEAMATGLPALYTNYSAMRDWVPRKYAWPLRFEMKKIRTLRATPEGGQEVHHYTYAASADVDQMVRKMAQVWSDYARAVELGAKASEHVRAITWDTSAASFMKAIRAHVGAKERVA